VITTSFVLLECGNAAARRPYKQAVDRLRQQLEKNDALIIPTSTDWESAWEMYRDTSPGQPGIVDLISFSVMRRLGIHTVFSNDAHFQRAGFEIVF
jgi:predicted nucleic acid-binding protein